MDRHHSRLAYASEMGTALAGSWRPGVVARQRQRNPIHNGSAVEAVDDVLWSTSLTNRYRWLKGVLALFQGAGVALLFPIFIVGLPVALALRVFLGLTEWRIVDRRP